MAGIDTEREIRVLIADDHTLFRGGLRQILADAGLTVVGDGRDGEEAVELARELGPDVAILDLHMPRMNGIEAAAEITKHARPPGVIVLTVSTMSDDVLDAIAAGAAGYLLKAASSEEIVAAVHAVASGQSPISPDVAASVIERVRAQTVKKRKKEKLPRMTDREKEVLRLIGLGRENNQIADELFLSPTSVKTIVAAVYDKLGVQTRVQAAVRAARAGLV